MIVGDIYMKKSVKAAFCGIATALCIVLMFAGSLFYVFSYAVPMLLGLITLMINKTFGKVYALYLYFSVAVLSLLFVPEKETVMMYVLFFGFYPVARLSIDKIKLKTVKIILKIVLFNFAVTAIELICVYVFGIPFFEDGVFSKSMLIFFTAAMNLSFLMYEFLLKSFTVLYERKIEERIKKALS